MTLPIESLTHWKAILPKKVNQDATPVQVIRLTSNDSDLAFLKRGLEQMQVNRASLIPVVSGVNHENHVELAEEAFDKSLALLTALKNGSLKQGPIVLIALNKANELLGISLGHIERTLANGQKQYTPLPLSSEEIAKNPSSLNWLVSFSPLKGVGKALTAIHESLLPQRVQRVDVVSEVPDYTVAAIPFYEKLGFAKKEALADQTIIFEKPAPENKTTFQDIHGMPMSVDRQVFSEKARMLREQMACVPESIEKPLDLKSLVKFKKYS